jgi:hypothetical protein
MAIPEIILRMVPIGKISVSIVMMMSIAVDSWQII